MTRTANLDLPLVQPSQAQKHVTVNEALGMLDGMCQLALQSAQVAVPPTEVIDGEVFGVPSDAQDAWSGKGGQLAVASNGGWRFVAPRTGWRAWLVDRAKPAIYDGATWVGGATAVSEGGAASVLEVVSVDVSPTSGASLVTEPVIPNGALVFGVTARVIEDLGGTLGSWRLGVPGAPDRYGSGLGTVAGSWGRGVTGQPQAYYSDTPLLVEAIGGAFGAGGTIRLAVHQLRMTLPRV